MISVRGHGVGEFSQDTINNVLVQVRREAGKIEILG